MIPLLQNSLVNPHATLITLFMNAVDENMTIQEERANVNHSPTTTRLMRYLPPSGLPSGPYDPVIIKFCCARDCVATYDRIFDR